MSKRGLPALVAFGLVLFLLVAEMVVPVRQASAAPVDLGPDGYFSTLGAGALPVVDKDDETPGIPQDGWANTRRIVFGKQGSTGTYGGATVSGGYKTLAKGAVASVPDANTFSQYGNYAYTKSATTSVAANEALLWADNTVTAGFRFDTNATYRNTFDSATGSYRSNLATVSDVVGAANYSTFEQGLLRVAPVEGVCTAAQPVGCSSGSYTQQSDSVNAYQVFPLSVGDLNRFAGTTSGWVSADANLACPSNTCANGASGSWLRSAVWDYAGSAFGVWSDGYPEDNNAVGTGLGLRPALRLNLDGLVLSALSGNQGQGASGDLRLTFVDPGKQLHTWSASVSGAAGSRMLSLSGSSDLGADMGWKVVDPVTNMVLGSGRTSAGGNMALPEALMPDVSKDYDLYVWGQQDGSAAGGLTNRATEPVKTTITGWQVKAPSAYGIEVTGTTMGGLRAYKIGDYADIVFDHTGALGSVKLTTPADPVRAALLAAAGVAGGVGVDAGNPIGWVGSHWLGYPTSPLSDDVTSAFSPYAGSLQLFARALAGDTGSLGPVAGSLPAGTFSSLSTVVLPVSGPGLYLVVDDSQASGGSLPIIVGTRVFNPDLGDDGGLVDFADAGVKGKPRLGRASLKTSITDVSKRVVNDAGMDGFDLGSQVEYEIALQVPDLGAFSSVSYAAYTFALSDVADAGLTLPAVSGVRVLMDVDPSTGASSPDLDVTGTSGLSVSVSGQTVSVDGLKAVFAESDGASGVRNKAGVPVGSLIRIRYAAVLNTGASLSAPGGGGLHPNVNTATLTRSRVAGVSSGWDDAGPGVESKSAVAHAYVFGLDLVKVDKDDTTRPLGGAGFEVSRDGQVLRFTKLSDGVYRLAVPGDVGVLGEVFSHTDGTLNILGVEARSLSLRETSAPSGYFKVPAFTVEVLPVWNTDASEVTLASYRTHGTSLAFVSRDGRAVMVADPAHSLANLPYTGGVGILILLVLAVLFLVFAVRPYYQARRAETTANTFG
ncbi:MAG: isopeptide-forming domain-containing fimbrial protein [Bifidobacterium psychraerophilum]|uniref:isopeptide-forming domain-containing fimbrial protein n=1 Tax=Bifidobacterium psychraerophilum TaxID=218140 RepID=UPI0039E96399